MILGRTVTSREARLQYMKPAKRIEQPPLYLFADRGETSLRGFEDPVRLFEVRWREES